MEEHVLWGDFMEEHVLWCDLMEKHVLCERSYGGTCFMG